jgi:cysteine-rich repeat protein
MRTLSRIIALCAVAALAACSVDKVSYTPAGDSVEDCGAAGDEDGNGLADCGDSACAGTIACKIACGNGRREAGEACDDGNQVSGDRCAADCKSDESCNNGIVDVAAGEVCDDGMPLGGPCGSDCKRGQGCGNGEVTADTGEECDDGNTDDADGCVIGGAGYECKLSRCGDGIIALNAAGFRREQCDGGAPDHTSQGPVETATCNIDCTLAACGDGKVNGHAGEQCDDGNSINGDGCDSNCRPTGCGSGVITGSEACDDGNSVNGDGCDSNCKLTSCGNSVVTAGEQCDDGNLSNGDGCDSNCQLAVCGNGIMVPPELCDDGNATSGDGCDSNCTPTACGNHVVTFGEACDDGNQTNGDGCDSNCRPTGCGSGIVTAGEVCDDGNLVNGDGCDSNCKPTACGNGVVVAPEVCDDGNSFDGDGCDQSCKPTGCGNGVVTGGEVCDDGNLVNGDGCDSNCKPTGCGNGVVTAGEQCDDGNSTDGDGCDSNCTVTVCGNCILTAGEVCDDCNTVNGDGCDSNCRISECGNGVVSGAEVCDDGNTTNGDGCDSNCTVTACGNGVVATGEVCDDGNLTDGDNCDSNCTPTACGNCIVTAGEQCDDCNGTNDDGCENDCTITIFGCGNGQPDPGEQCDDGNNKNYDGCDNDCTISRLAYVKASNTGGSDVFGWNVALSADGSTLAVGAPAEDSAATGINGNQASNLAGDSGAVYVFTRSGATWVQQAYIKASNTGAIDRFGWSVALSADGSTLAVGAYVEDSAATGINGDQTNNSAPDSGAVYVFTRSGTAWSQQAYVKASSIGTSDFFGFSVALSGDGATLAVGAVFDDGVANSTTDSGAAYVFTRSGVTWSQQAYITASNAEGSDELGYSIALSGDGSTLAVGARIENSAATGINGDQTNNSAPASGAVYVFTRSGTVWSQQAYIKASNTSVSDEFGYSISLSGDGSTLAVGAVGEDSAATGINGNQTDNSATNAGAVYVFARSGTAWSQEAYVKASNTGATDNFGYSVALSGDGSVLAVGAYLEDSAATSTNGSQADNSAPNAGAAYVFARSGATWSQQTYVKAFNTAPSDGFGSCVALSGDGSTLAVGAYQEDSAATGVGGDQSNNNASNSGAVYVYE